MPDRLKSTSYLGKTVYHDLDNGQTHTIPWGGADWLLAIGMVVMLSAFAAMLIGLAVTFWRGIA